VVGRALVVDVSSSSIRCGHLAGGAGVRCGRCYDLPFVVDSFIILTKPAGIISRLSFAVSSGMRYQPEAPMPANAPTTRPRPYQCVIAYERRRETSSFFPALFRRRW